MDIQHLPHSPGVYLMRDLKGKIVYIGKAKDLRKRVSSYFYERLLPPKLTSLLSVVRHVDYIPTASERECLLLEQKLIRKIQPVYNTMWRDDKTYPYVKLTLNEDYPRLVITRQKKNDGGKYFGPYPHVGMVKKLLRTLWLKKFFALRPCRFEFTEKQTTGEGGLAKANPALHRKVQSCIYLHTRECPAPCMNRSSKEAYREIARKAELFFRGQFKPLEEELERDMKQAAEDLDFERAGQIRDQLAALHHMAERVTIQEVNESMVVEQTQVSRGLTELQTALDLPRPPLRIECFDISNIQGTLPVASMVVFERGTPLKSDYRKFKIKTVQGPNDFAMMAEVVRRRYSRVLREGRKWPDLILLDGGKGQLSSGMQALESVKKQFAEASLPAIHIAGLAKENEELFLPGRRESVRLPKDSPGLHIVQHIRDEAHRFAVAFHRLRRDKAALGRLTEEEL